jgi:hypothetical protein
MTELLTTKCPGCGTVLHASRIETCGQCGSALHWKDEDLEALQVEALRAEAVALQQEVEQLKSEVESRRLRARRAVELLRETFKLRPGCKMVDDAAEDACAEYSQAREVSPAAECVALWLALPAWSRMERCRRLRKDGGGIAADCLEVITDLGSVLDALRHYHRLVCGLFDGHDVAFDKLTAEWRRLVEARNDG